MAIALLSWCTASTSAQAQTSTITVASESTPEAFDDEFEAALVARPDAQWLAIGGVDVTDSDPVYGIKVFQRTASGPWLELPALPARRFSDGQGLSLVLQDPADPSPCVGYGADGGPQLRCLADGVWRSAIRAGRHRGEQMYDVIAPTMTSLAVLFAKKVRHETTLRVERGTTSGHFRRVGGPIEGPLLAQFVQPTSRPQVRLGVEDEGRGTEAKRYIMRPVGNRWVRDSPVARAPAGPFVGGPIVAGPATYFPATDAIAFPFEFRVLRLGPGELNWDNVGSGPLNAGVGSGQGTLGVLDGRPWAIWQEDAEQAEGFQSEIRVAGLEATTDADNSTLLWAGKRIGPGSVQLVDGPGSLAYALYERGTDTGLQTVVATLALS
ncbi:MAG: hypothetical protein QOI10_1561 [Solirubrobacterales bacterium]|nr:hypothetical protein [Solirubrobacterales bacterium]